MKLKEEIQSILDSVYTEETSTSDAKDQLVDLFKRWAFDLVHIDHPEGIDNAFDWYQALDTVEERIKKSTK